MREILFRGKRVDNGEWVEGSLLTTYYNIPKEIWYYNDKLITYINIIPETVGQFIGLHDKNGKKVFEGDIVKYYQPYSKNWDTHIVKWDAHFAGFALFENDNIWAKESDWLKITEIEIIGNIYEKEANNG